MTATKKYGDNTVDADAVTTRAESKLSWWWFVGLLAIVISIWFAYYWFAPDLIDRMGNRDPNSVWTTRGQFGDMFGALNALFSAIAFAALVYTVFLQRTELELQRKELHDTREEIRGQKLQLEAQTKAFLTQNFESLFFQQIARHDKVVKRIVDLLATRMGSSLGPEALQVLSKLFVDTASRNVRSIRLSAPSKQPDFESWGEEVTWMLGCGLKKTELNDSVLSTWDTFVAKHKEELGLYFRSFELIVQHIDTGTGLLESNEIPRGRYVDIMVSQMSSDDLVLLFYHARSPGGTRLKKLIERYHLLRHLDDDKTLAPWHRDAFEPSAFSFPDDT
jgi:hypothetical protein